MKLKTVKNYFLFVTLMLVQKHLFSQEVEMADAFRAEGKIYVVIAVIALVFLGFIGYLINLDLKLKRLEKDFKENED